MRLAAVTLTVLLAAAAAHAQEPPPADAPPPAAGVVRPWAEGISPERQAEAFQIFEEGNREFEQLHHAQALTIYRRAIAVWDHPAIRYNMAVSLINLDQLLSAYENLESALRFGPDALLPKQYQDAQTYRKLLLAQLAQLTVACQEPGAQVLLDGQVVLVGPGETTRVVLPGSHQLVASKEVYLTATRALSLSAGQAASEEIHLLPMPRAARTERRWAVWKPWAVVGAGVGVALVGIPFRIASASSYDDYDAQVTAACPQGCHTSDLASSVTDVKDRARLQNGVAIGLFAAGTAVAAGGVVLLLMNQPQTVEDERDVKPRAVGLVPILVPGAAGLTLAGDF